MSYLKAVVLLVCMMIGYTVVGTIEYNFMNVIDVVQDHKAAIELLNN